MIRTLAIRAHMAICHLTGSTEHDSYKETALTTQYSTAIDIYEEEVSNIALQVNRFILIMVVFKINTEYGQNYP